MKNQQTNTSNIKTGILTGLNTLLFICAFMGAVAHAASITVTTSRNPVSLDDSFHLVYEADSSVDGDPDFTPIYEHFDVLSSSQSTNMRSINGNWSMKKSWDLAVIAKDIGKFTIPPINFGKDISPAIQVTVTSSTSPNSTNPDGSSTIPAKIFLESAIDKKSGWVQSQFIYTVRLLRTVNITGASLSEPETSDPDAIIRLISEDQYQTTRNGIRHEVIERRYAIFPQKSGQLKIKPVTFEGRVNATQSRSIFDQFRMSGQLKRLRSKAVEATVKAAPTTINLQDWLPASNVKLIEEWSGDIQDIKAGEPVTRTILIAAEGLTGVQLPELQFEDIKGLKQYPDKPVIEDKQSATGITGFKQFKVALIPASAGAYTLPEIKLQWWNTKTSKTEVVTLPQVNLTVTGSVDTPTPSIPAGDIIPQEKPLSTASKTPQAVTMTESGAIFWKGLSLFLALAWLLTLLLLFKKPKSHRTSGKIKTEKTNQSIKSAVSAVEKNAKANNPENTRNALIEWAKINYKNKNISNLSQISKYCSAQLKQSIRQLNQTLYGTEKTSWDGEELLNAFKDEQRLTNNKQDKHTPVLKPLYNQ